MKLLAAPGTVKARPSLEDLLGPLGREALAALLVKRSASAPEFLLWLEAELAVGAPDGLSAGLRRTAIDAEPIRRRAEALLSVRTDRSRGWRDDVIGVDEDAVSALIGKARPFIEAGDGRNALVILCEVAEVLVPAWRARADWDETLHELFPELGQLVAEAILLGELAPDEQDELRARLEVWHGELDDYGLEDNLQVGLDALEHGWHEIGLADVLAGRGQFWPVSGERDWAADKLTEARLRVLDVGGRAEEFLNFSRAAGRHGDHAKMLIKLGRPGDAAIYARDRFTTADEVLQLVRLLQTGGEIESALDLGRWGLSLRPDSNRLYGLVGLARWLRDCARALGRRDLALTAAAAAFEHSLSRDDFREAEAVAGQEWTPLRSRLLAKLAAAEYANDRTEIFLDEGMVDEAVKSVDVENTLRDPRNRVLLRLAGAACGSHPDWVIDCCERMAANVMESGQAGLYEDAAKWLQKAALAYDAAGRHDDWSRGSTD